MNALECLGRWREHKTEEVIVKTMGHDAEFDTVVSTKVTVHAGAKNYAYD